VEGDINTGQGDCGKTSLQDDAAIIFYFSCADAKQLSMISLNIFLPSTMVNFWDNYEM